MKIKKSVLAILGLVSAVPALAHISYTNRNFGTIATGSNVTISNQTVSGNFGWADASDLGLAFDTNYASWHTVDSASYTSSSFTDGLDNLYFGDSHKGKAFRFHLDTTHTLSITGTANATATGTSVGGLATGFSVYQGLAAISPFPATQTSLPSSADHDFAAASQAWRTTRAQSINASYNYLATQGSWNALGNWYIGGDGDASGDVSKLSFFQYVGSAATTVHNGTASGTFTLGPGDYTIFVGGNDILAKNQLDSVKAYGVSLQVTAVPEPESYAMLLAGLGLIGAIARRRQENWTHQD